MIDWAAIATWTLIVGFMLWMLWVSSDGKKARAWIAKVLADPEPENDESHANVRYKIQEEMNGKE